MSVILALLLSCGNQPAPAPTPPPASEPPAPVQADFDADRAMATLVDLTERGHRYYGAPKREQAIAHLMDELRAVSDEVQRHDLTVTEPVSGTDYVLSNLVGRLWPDVQPRILLGSHWDTRLWAEEDPDPTKRQLPIPGANDGTSGVAVLLELARTLRQGSAPPAMGIDIVLFDGEEFGRPNRGGYCKGSEAFAKDIRRFYPAKKPVGGIVLDMVCDRDLSFRREPTSDAVARPLVDLLWKHGRAQRPDAFLQQAWPPIVDDQTPLQSVGIPSILVIDFDYPYWHTHADTVDKCDPKSLDAIGDALLKTVRELDGRFDRKR